MKVAIVYDSQFGNTRALAEKMAKSFFTKDTVEIQHVKKINVSQLKNLDLLIIGTPTHGGQATPEIMSFIKKLTPLTAKKVACFDTRTAPETVGFGLKLLMKVIGFAAPKMAKVLRAKNAAVVGVDGFWVEGSKGPLVDGEAKRALEWVKSL